MFLIIIGIIVIIIGFAIAKADPKVRVHSTTVKIIGIALLVIGVLIASLVQIEPGQVGVQKLFGKVSNNTLQSGLNFINPLVQVVPFDIRTQNYTMAGKHDEGDQMGDDAIRVLSADGLEVVVDLTVLYKVVSSEAPKILREIGADYKNTIVRPICRTKIRDNAVYYDAVALYSTKRDEF